ncbi:ABC transporter ATP-binding protein [Clostridium amazonitimonense]|uniref:ABC transporter ATP-binding protein n=1 Tax=Clostridium amazonitimonense TaxID=1499689 RepID=UPI000509F2D5|nr:ABC transporter ATP-binding protein [Clostridium amazonitimonense]
MKVTITNLRKQYEEVIAVDDLNVIVKDGELVSILGPSGCGKSTLLYMLAGIVDPTAGKISFNEEIINSVPIEKRNIGLVFQNYSLYPHLTVLENLIFPLRMKGMKKGQAIEEAKIISKTLRIEELLKRKPKELSGGQQQRVAIGRALIKKPGLLLMDEPFSNLDAALRVEMREEIRRLQKDFNITTLFVTHDQEEALSISDKILLMHKGKAIQYSTGEELYHNPNSVYGARFIGSPKINIFEKSEFIRFFNNSEHISEDGDIKNFGVRPEDIEIYTKKEYEELIPAYISNVLSLGRDTHITLVVKGIEIRAIITGESSYNVGQDVYLKFKKIHRFKD